MNLFYSSIRNQSITLKIWNQNSVQAKKKQNVWTKDPKLLHNKRTKKIEGIIL